MVTACLISSIAKWNGDGKEAIEDSESTLVSSESYTFDSLDGPSEEEVYQQGMIKLLWGSSSSRLNSDFRRIQSYLTARWCLIERKVCETVDRSGDRPYARCTELAQSDL